MTHSSRYFPYVVGAAVVAAVLIAVGAPLASLVPFAFVLVCPLMMFFMMKGMAGMHGGSGEDHTGHGCDHDPTRRGWQCQPGTGAGVAQVPGPRPDRSSRTSGSVASQPPGSTRRWR